MTRGIVLDCFVQRFLCGRTVTDFLQEIAVMNSTMQQSRKCGRLEKSLDNRKSESSKVLVPYTKSY